MKWKTKKLKSKKQKPNLIKWKTKKLKSKKQKTEKQKLSVATMGFRRRVKAKAFPALLYFKQFNKVSFWKNNFF